MSNTEEGMNEVLIYNERRSIQGTVQITEELSKLFGIEYKIYVRGIYDNKTGLVMIDSLVSQQYW